MVENDEKIFGFRLWYFWLESCSSFWFWFSGGIYRCVRDPFNLCNHFLRLTEKKKAYKMKNKQIETMYVVQHIFWQETNHKPKHYLLIPSLLIILTPQISINS